MPQLGETVAEGTVTRWYKKVGDAVKAEDVLFDVETDKVSTEIPAQASGVLAEILVAEGTTAKVGTRLAVILESMPQPSTGVGGANAAAPLRAAAAAPARGSRGQSPVAAPRAADGRLSPVVRKLLARHALDPAAIAGTGRDGRITRENVLAHLARRAAAAPAGSPGAAVEPAGAAGEEIVPLNAIRRRTAEHMARSWAGVPHVLQVIEADFSRVGEARRAAGAQWKAREGYSLTYLPFIAHATVAALARYPRLNARFDGDRLLVQKRVNLGIAVDLDRDGLVVPVIRDAGALSLPGLARAIGALVARARAGKLKPDDMTGGTYTITNNGAFGTLITAPIVSAPQVAILSSDGIRKRPVVIEGPGGDAIAIRAVGMLAQTFDHRAVDGAYSGAFLTELKRQLETRDWPRELGVREDA